MTCFHLNNMKLLLKKTKINPLFWLVIGIGVVTGYFREIIMVFSIVFIHELGHAFAALYFNWRIQKIELLPFGGVAEIDHADEPPFYQEVVVLIAGPLQHIWLVGLSYICLSFPFWSAADHRLFVWHNAVIFMFNLLPILPLDGGRLLQLFFTYRHSYSKALHHARLVSFFILAVFISISMFILPIHLNLWIVLSFLVIANYLEWRQRHYRFIRFLMARHSNKRHKWRHSVVTVSDSMPLREVMKLCRRGYEHHFKIVQVKSGTTVIVEEKELLNLFFSERRPHASLSSFNFPFLS